MKVLFISTSWDGLMCKKGRRFSRAWPPLCLLNCTALLEREGIEVGVIDTRAGKINQAELARSSLEFHKVFVTSSPEIAASVRHRKHLSNDETSLVHSHC